MKQIFIIGFITVLTLPCKSVGQPTETPDGMLLPAITVTKHLSPEVARILQMEARIEAQKNEVRSDSIPPRHIDDNVSTFDLMPWDEMYDTLRRQFSTPASAPPCSDREREIRKMQVDIECLEISPEELGFLCDTSNCEGGVHDAFIVKQDAIHIGDPICEYIVAVYPALPRLPVGRILRGNQGNERLDWMFVCKQCFYERGDTMTLD